MTWNFEKDHFLKHKNDIYYKKYKKLYVPTKIFYIQKANESTYCCSPPNDFIICHADILHGKPEVVKDIQHSLEPEKCPKILTDKAILRILGNLAVWTSLGNFQYTT